MTRIASIVLAAFWLTCTSHAGDLTPAATRPASNKPAAIFDRLVGAWLGDHAGTGEADRARVVYEAGIADQLVKCRSYTVNGKGEAKLRYETFIYYHPRDKQLRAISVGSTGGIFDGSVGGTRDELLFEFSAYLKDDRVDYKQSIRFLSDDRYQWTVWQKQGEDWKQVIEGTFTRDASVSAR
jgi:hypothetical protein